MSDLFDTECRLRPTEMPDADVSYLSGFFLAKAADELLHRLARETPWRSEKITVWGKTYDQPRLISWYGDPGRRYRYSGVELDPLPWTPDLLSVKVKAEKTTLSTFNSVLLNYYRDNRDSMGLHSDDEPELGKRPVIASVSLGDIRTLVFKHKTNANLATVKIPLESGSLMLMQGDTQLNWKHGINKESRPCGPRINLTFRRILS